MSSSVTIYHNPRCSKSRQTLALLEEKGLDIVKVEYLKQTPSTDDVLALSKALECSVSEIVRKNEAAYKAMENPPDDSDDQAMAKMIAENPVLLQRPIVVNGSRAAVGRPPESVLSIL
ncbi:MAG: arsenate reductase (glutaredoxin) [Granulosicoccus sp.]|nr:arsenate reductase (glutaredoxin) [Granulosicoccus sp.]